jgi:hypothetical protein
LTGLALLLLKAPLRGDGVKAQEVV